MEQFSFAFDSFWVSCLQSKQHHPWWLWRILGGNVKTNCLNYDVKGRWIAIHEGSRWFDWVEFEKWWGVTFKGRGVNWQIFTLTRVNERDLKELTWSICNVDTLDPMNVRNNNSFTLRVINKTKRCWVNQLLRTCLENLSKLNSMSQIVRNWRRSDYE